MKLTNAKLVMARHEYNTYMGRPRYTVTITGVNEEGKNETIQGRTNSHSENVYHAYDSGANDWTDVTTEYSVLEVEYHVTKKGKIVIDSGLIVKEEEYA